MAKVRVFKFLGSFTLLTGSMFVAMLAFFTMCCAPMLSRIPERTDQMSRAVEVRTMCGTFANLLEPQPGRVSLAFGAGSGVIVGPHKILTASHVALCEDKQNAIVWVKLGGAWVQATLTQTYMPSRDVAALYVVADTGFGPIEFRSSVMQHESVCAAFAFPMAHYDCGSFKEYRTPRQGINGVLGIPVVSGNSGSGLFDRSGRLVGIITAQTLCHVEIVFGIDDAGELTFEPKAHGGPDCDGLASMLDDEVRP